MGCAGVFARFPSENTPSCNYVAMKRRFRCLSIKSKIYNICIPGTCLSCIFGLDLSKQGCFQSKQFGFLVGRDFICRKIGGDGCCNLMLVSVLCSALFFHPWNLKPDVLPRSKWIPSCFNNSRGWSLP